MKKNVLSNWAVLPVSMLVAFFLTPYLIRYLTKDVYGIWATLGSIVGTYGLLDLGVSSALGRYVAYYLGRDDCDSANKTFNSAFVLFCGIGIFILALAFILPEPLAVFFKISQTHYKDFQHCLWFLGIASAISFPSIVMRTVVISHEHFVPCNIARILTELSRFGLCIAAIKFGYGLQGLAVATLLVAFLSLVFHSVLFFVFCPSIVFKLSMVNWVFTRQLIIYGLPASVTVLADILRNRLDNIIIARWLDMSWVTIYVVGVFLTHLLRRFVVAISGVLDPRFSRLCGGNNYQEIKRLYLKALAISTSFTLSAALSMVLIGKSFITLWVGPGFEDSYPVLVILIIGQICAASQMPTVSLVFALNKHRFCALLVLLEGAANVALSILLVRYWGISGVAVGTLIPMVLCKMIILPWYARGLLDVSFVRFYRTIFRPFLVLAPVGGILIYLFRASMLSWAQVVILAASSGILFLITANWLGLSKEHRYSLASIKDFIKSLMPG